MIPKTPEKTVATVANRPQTDVGVRKLDNGQYRVTIDWLCSFTTDLATIYNEEKLKQKIGQATREGLYYKQVQSLSDTF